MGVTWRHSAATEKKCCGVHIYHEDVLKLYKEIMVGLNCHNTAVETRIKFGKNLMALLPSNVTKLCTLHYLFEIGTCW